MMCELCATAMDECFPKPEYDDETQNFVLWNCTAFPFGEGEYVAKQIRQAREFVDEQGRWPEFLVKDVDWKPKESR